MPIPLYFGRKIILQSKVLQNICWIWSKNTTFNILNINTLKNVSQNQITKNKIKIN